MAVGVGQIRAFAGVAEAAGHLDAVVGVGLVLDGLVGGGVVAQAGGRVELEHPDAAEPGAVHHPHRAVLVGFDGRVDGVDAGVALRLVSGQVRVLAQHLLHVGAVHVDLGESGVDDRAHVGPVALDVVGGQQHDHGAVVVAVDGQVHAPLAHRLVPEHVRRPHVALDVRVGGLLGPFLPDVGEDRLVVGAQVVLEGLPVDQIGALGPRAVGAEDVVGVAVLDDGRVVRGDALDLGRRVAALAGGLRAGASGEGRDHQCHGGDGRSDSTQCGG